mmetsp:Transcript_11052/g.29562  ORF Transcript_11052/g.29562 Transcript_11052/m.29562 type:complete len:226 (-) Transcript_11052:263-940(-)
MRARSYNHEHEHACVFIAHVHKAAHCAFNAPRSLQGPFFVHIALRLPLCTLAIGSLLLPTAAASSLDVGTAPPGGDFRLELWPLTRHLVRHPALKLRQLHRARTVVVHGREHVCQSRVERGRVRRGSLAGHHREKAVELLEFVDVDAARCIDVSQLEELFEHVLRIRLLLVGRFWRGRGLGQPIVKRRRTGHGHHPRRRRHAHPRARCGRRREGRCTANGANGEY